MRLDGEMEIMKKKSVYESRVDGVRKAAAFRIDALETALNETKLKLARERERSEMLLSEMESFYLSKWVPNEKIEAAMKQAPPLVE